MNKFGIIYTIEKEFKYITERLYREISIHKIFNIPIFVFNHIYEYDNWENWETLKDRK